MKKLIDRIIQFWFLNIMYQNKTQLSFLIIGMIFILCPYYIQAQNEIRKTSIILNGTGNYEITLADIVMEVDANCGARIISFRLKNQEVLSSSGINQENYGSTLWLSPQIWKWPPSPILDTKPYQCELNKNTLNLTSQPDSLSGCKISKNFVANSSDSSFSIKYLITNISKKDKSVAPWEVTRVPAGGISFFPIGTTGGFSKSNLNTEDKNGICWFRYEPELVTGHQKLFRNGHEGWLAHVNNGLVFIKQFPDIGIELEAPNETEIELYTNKDRTYIELENQGPYQTLHQRESISWTVKWYLRELPPTVGIAVGSESLANFVRKIITKK